MTMRKKSINDLDAQFGRIWQACIENCDCYQELYKQTDGRLEPWQYFQSTDNRLRSGVGLSEKDRRNDSRIVRVAAVARRYMDNLRRIGGFNDSTGYLATGDRMEAYQNFRDVKFPVERYMDKVVTGSGKMVKIKAVVECGSDGGFTAHSDSVPGVYANGKTKEEVCNEFIDMIQEQAEYMEQRTGESPVFKDAEVEFVF